MKKSIAILFGIVSALAGPAAAQEPAGMIAFDYCQLYDWDQGVVCSVFLVAADGSKGAYVGDGVDPAWSPDGSRIAFGNFPGIFVVNLGDWSVIDLSVNGQSPAWSPDGLKLAFAGDELYVMNVDGSDVVQITNSIGFVGQPAWSPDGNLIAFDCVIDAGNLDICAIHPDGTGLVRLTTGLGSESGPAFSPDGLKIAFSGAIMNTDGTGISPGFGGEPAWSPDGTRLAYVVGFEGACNADGHICSDTIYISNVDGALTDGNRPAWALATRPVAWFLPQGCDGLTCAFDGSGSWGGDGGIVSYVWNFEDGTTDSGPAVTHSYSTSGIHNVTLTVMDTAGVTGTRTDVVDVVGNMWPTASFTYACSGSQCTFDGSGSSDSDGSIASYYWIFGDGETGGGTAGSTASHKYAAASDFTVTLIVTDNGGAKGQQQQMVPIAVVSNTPPVASFTAACTELTCTFNASGSSDADGTITSYAWNFGDGTTGTDVIASRTYAAGGTYSVTLLVTDNAGAASTQAKNVTLQSDMHVGDLDRARTVQQSTWTATVTIGVHGSSHDPVASVSVNGSWNNGTTAACTTNASGQCVVSRAGIPKNTGSVIFTITNLTRPTFMYKPADNHDPDGDSNGTAITVTRQ
jgi:PKD repeat protein